MLQFPPTPPRESLVVGDGLGFGVGNYVVTAKQAIYFAASYVFDSLRVLIFAALSPAIRAWGYFVSHWLAP